MTAVRKIPTEDYAAIEAEVRAGAKQDDIAARYGCTRQAVCIILRARGVSSRTLRNERVAREAAVRHAEALYERTLGAMAEARPCPVCGCWVLRQVGSGRAPRNRTCSPGCAEIWPSERYNLDPIAHDSQRRAAARWTLSHPDHPTVDATKLAWAAAVLSDDPPPPNRRFRISKTRVSTRGSG